MNEQEARELKRGDKVEIDTAQKEIGTVMAVRTIVYVDYGNLTCQLSPADIIRKVESNDS